MSCTVVIEQQALDQRQKPAQPSEGNPRVSHDQAYLRDGADSGYGSKASGSEQVATKTLYKFDKDVPREANERFQDLQDLFFKPLFDHAFRSAKKEKHMRNAFLFEPSYNTLCGLTMTTSENGVLRQVATLGGTIACKDKDGNSRLWCLTVDHVFHSQGNGSDRFEASDVSEDGDDQTENETEDSEVEICLETSDGGLRAGVPRMRDLNLFKNSLSGDTRKTISTSALIKDTQSSQISHYYDWALVDLTNIPNVANKILNHVTRGFKPHQITKSGNLELDQENPSRGLVARGRRALILTASNNEYLPPLVGVMSSNPSFIHLGIGDSPITVLSLKLSETPSRSLAKGDCGAWVVDAENCDVYGHVVALDPFGDALIIPIEDILHDIKGTLGLQQVGIHGSEIVSPHKSGNVDELEVQKDSAMTWVIDDTSYDHTNSDLTMTSTLPANAPAPERPEDQLALNEKPEEDYPQGRRVSDEDEEKHEYPRHKPWPYYDLYSYTRGTVPILSHYVPVRQRFTHTTIMTAASGIAFLVGPLIGGAFTVHLSWRWCFYINLPLVGITGFSIFFFYPLKQPKTPTVKGLLELLIELRKRMRKDRGSLRLFTDLFLELERFGLFATFIDISGLICLLLALWWGGTTHAWSDWRIILLFVLFATLYMTSVAMQAWRREYAISPFVLGQRSIHAGLGFAFCMSAAFSIINYYMPIWFQAIKGAPPIKSGAMSLPLVVIVPVLSIVVRSAITHVGYYMPFMIASSIFMSAGAGLLTTLHTESGLEAWIGYQVCFTSHLLAYDSPTNRSVKILFGTGVGLGTQLSVIAVQTMLLLLRIPSEGEVLIMSVRHLGDAIFISIGQNVFENRLVSNLRSMQVDVNVQAIRSSGATTIRNLVPAENLPNVLTAYNSAINEAFYAVVGIAALSAMGTILTKGNHSFVRTNHRTPKSSYIPHSHA
ncbi:MAG: hypothetical protein Q9165_001246 [Trypethelium subeluteriae]